ncbi:MAG TPA: 1-deoxy-D-xylulose-5-phosphate synthase N-terminal domain-containing protein [Bryobacteraceae bacterium]
MPIAVSRYNLLERGFREALALTEPERFQYRAEGGAYLDLRRLALEPLPEIDEDRIARLCRIVRGLLFAAVDAAQSGHPGGSSSKAEQALTLLLSGALGFDPLDPKNPGRDRIVWSAGHCSPLFHSLLALIYGSLRERGQSLLPDKAGMAVLPEHLARFRRWGGPSGHVESEYALADTSTGSSGHGFSAGLGFALLHRSCGLATRAFVIAGDAETEEGMTYEARNLAANLGVRNLVVSLDYNTYGIDGSIFEAMPGPYQNHWFAHGWNVIEVDGHDVRELAYAYRLAVEGLGPDRPTVVIAHTTKGIHYGKLENTADSHGMPLSHDEYVAAMRKIGFDIPGNPAGDIAAVMQALDPADRDYLLARLDAAARRIPDESALVDRMDTMLYGRHIRDYRAIERPDPLPPELVFSEGTSVATRKATEA